MTVRAGEEFRRVKADVEHELDRLETLAPTIERTLADYHYPHDWKQQVRDSKGPQRVNLADPRCVLGLIGHRNELGDVFGEAAKKSALKLNGIANNIFHHEYAHLRTTDGTTAKEIVDGLVRDAKSPASGSTDRSSDGTGQADSTSSIRADVERELARLSALAPAVENALTATHGRDWQRIFEERSDLTGRRPNVEHDYPRFVLGLICDDDVALRSVFGLAAGDQARELNGIASKVRHHSENLSTSDVATATRIVDALLREAGQTVPTSSVPADFQSKLGVPGAINSLHTAPPKIPRDQPNRPARPAGNRVKGAWTPGTVLLVVVAVAAMSWGYESLNGGYVPKEPRLSQRQRAFNKARVATLGRRLDREERAWRAVASEVWLNAPADCSRTRVLRQLAAFVDGSKGWMREDVAQPSGESNVKPLTASRISATDDVRQSRLVRLAFAREPLRCPNFTVAAPAVEYGVLRCKEARPPLSCSDE